MDPRVPARLTGERLSILIGELASIDARSIGKAVGSARDAEDEVRRALERISTGSKPGA